MSALEDITGLSKSGSAPGSSALESITGVTPKSASPVSTPVVKAALPSPKVNPADTSKLFSDFNNGIPNLGISGTKTTTPTTTKVDVISDFSKGISTAVNAPISKAADALSNTTYMKQAAEGINQGSEAGLFAQELTRKLSYGLEGLTGVTGGLYQAPENPTEDIVDKGIKAAANGLGAMLSIGTLGKIIPTASAVEGLGGFVQKFPLLAKYAAPYIKPLVESTAGFASYGQLDPKLGNDLITRAKKLAVDVGTAPLYTALGAIKNPALGLSGAFALGYGSAKLSGASNEDALVGGLTLAFMDAGGRAEKMTYQLAQDHLMNEAGRILSPFAKTKIGAKSSQAEINQAYFKALHEVHPSVGGNKDALESVRSAYDLLSKGKATAPEAQGAEKNITTFRNQIRTSLNTNGHDVTHQALRDNLGVDVPTADRLIGAARRPQTPEEEQALLKKVQLPQEKESLESIAPIAKPKTENVSRETDPLMEEAKKYKTAEDFVKAQKLVYHGTQTNLKRFTNKQGTFFTDDQMNADGYAGGENVYEGYLNLKKPLVIDAGGRKWDDLESEYGKSTREVVANVDSKKYDGVIFKNIKDSWIDDADAQDPSTVYYSFKPKDAFLNESQLTELHEKATAPINNTETVKAPEAKVSKKKDSPFKSRVFERLQQEHPDILKGDLNYDPIKLKEDAARAVDLIAKDKNEAFRVAMGIETSKDVASTAVNIAMFEKALDDGNDELAAKLIKNRSLAQTRRGQEIASEKGSVSDNSTSRYVKEVLADRLEKLGKGYLSKLTNAVKHTSNKEKAIKTIDEEVKKVKKAVKNTKEMDLAEAQAIIDKLSC